MKTNAERQRQTYQNKKDQGMHKIGFWLSAADKERLEAYADERGMVMADAIMEMLSEAGKMNLVRTETIYRMGHY